MGHVPPPRQWTFAYNLETSQAKGFPPTVFALKRAWTSAAAPLPIVCPADEAVPPDQRYVFVNYREAAVSQDAAHFVQHEPRILSVVQNITEQYRIEALVSDREMASVVRNVIDAGRGAASEIEPNHSCAKHAL